MRDETGLDASEHRVQLFDSSKSLADTVSAFLLDALAQGGPVIIVATPEHRELLTRRLEDAGWDVRRAVAANRIMIADMVDVLAARGNLRGAQQLEELWNLLATRECITLFCGYASGHFGDPRTARALAAICAAHDEVHRKADDILAEFLLGQHDVKPAVER